MFITILLTTHQHTHFASSETHTQFTRNLYGGEMRSNKKKTLPSYIILTYVQTCKPNWNSRGFLTTTTTTTWQTKILHMWTFACAAYVNEGRSISNWKKNMIPPFYWLVIDIDFFFAEEHQIIKFPKNCGKL